MGQTEAIGVEPSSAEISPRATCEIDCGYFDVEAGQLQAISRQTFHCFSAPLSPLFNAMLAAEFAPW